MQSETPINPATPTLATVNQVDALAGLRWLSLGWQDFRRAGWPSLLHGLIVTVVSVAIVSATYLYWPLLPGAVSGFVLIGPILATGLYALSRRLEAGQSASLGAAFDAWRYGFRYLLGFGALLVAAGTAWVLVSVLMFHFFVQTEINAPVDFLRYVIAQDDLAFVLWAVLGGLGVALVFGLTVVSVPLLIDREIDMRDAMRVSMQAVGENPLPAAIWAMLIAVITGVSIATLMLGFLILYPVLGHASWHAYRDLVRVDRLDPRVAPE